jgi:hypothetical protein
MSSNDELSDEYVNEDEERKEEQVEDAMDTHSTHRNTVPWGQKHIRHEPDEDDDELMMYANFKVLALQPIPHPPKNHFVDVDASQNLFLHRRILTSPASLTKSTSRDPRVAKALPMSQRNAQQLRTSQRKSVERRRRVQGARHVRSGEDEPEPGLTHPFPDDRFRFLYFIV